MPPIPSCWASLSLLGLNFYRTTAITCKGQCAHRAKASVLSSWSTCLLTAWSSRAWIPRPGALMAFPSAQQVAKGLCQWNLRTGTWVCEQERKVQLSSFPLEFFLFRFSHAILGSLTPRRCHSTNYNFLFLIFKIFILPKYCLCFPFLPM